MNGFDSLSPDAVIIASESAFGRRFLPIVTPYPSYVNRVYGLTDEDGTDFIVKFYRPGRWSTPAIAEEHAFLARLAAEDIPVVPPLPDPDGDTLAEAEVQAPEGNTMFRFALFPKRAGRLFDAEDDESWYRIGALCGRLHQVGRFAEAPERVTWTPGTITAEQIDEIVAGEMIPADMAEEFRDLAGSTLEAISPLFDDVPLHRVHGDLHRGNILDRRDEGLLLIDLDDMANGPAMQDLWLLMPGYRGEVGRETGLLAEGYEEFLPFPWEQLKLMEPLRLMRMIHFIAWCGRQRHDRDFHTHFPDWGSRSWWIRELEDLRDQAARIAAGSES